MAGRIIFVSIALVLIALGLTVPFLPLQNVTATPAGTLSQVSSGLVHEDSLTSGGSGCTWDGSKDNSTSNINTDYWLIYGDAVNEGSTWTACEGSSGLWLGSEGSSQYGWAGIYAESPNETVMLFHADLTLPAKTIESGGDFNTGLYVQTANGLINYVACYANVLGPDEYQWGAEIATGNTQETTNNTEIWNGPVQTGTSSSTEDCTIVTNGANILYVYMDGTLVYGSTNAGLTNMPEPFNAYLEVESHDASQLLWASYTDYYSNLNSSVAVQGVPAGDTAEIFDGSTVEATATNTGSAVQTLYLGIAQYELPLAGTLEIVSGSNTVLASTSSTSFWGGDVYSYTPATTSSSSSSSTTSKSSSSSCGSSGCSLTVLSENTLGNTITGYYTELLTSSGSVVTDGFTPVTFTLSSGVGYEVQSDSYTVCTFSHWEGGGLSGSTTDPAPISITSPTTIEAVYSGSSCGPQTTNTTTTTTTTSTTPTSTSTTPTTTSTTSTTTSSTMSTSTTSTTSTKTTTTSSTSTTTTSSEPSSLAPDGSASTGCGYVTSCSVKLTTASSGPDVIIVGCNCYPISEASTFSVSDTAGLTFHSLAEISIGGNEFMEEWYAIAPSRLTSDTISVTSTDTGETWYGVVAFGISGANTANPFDPNPSLPVGQTNTLGCPSSLPCNTGVSTTNPNDFVFQIGGDTGSTLQTAGAGMTLIQATKAGEDIYGQYEVLSGTTLSSATLSFGTAQGYDFGVIAVAVQAGSATTTTTSTTPTTTTTTSTTPTTTTTTSTTSTTPTSTSTTPTTTTTTSTTPTTTTTTTTTTSSGAPSVTVESVNQDGQTITGYWTVLRTSSGTTVSTGYTTKTFTDVKAGTTYELELDSYTVCTFEYWQGTTNSGLLTFTATDGPQTFVGVYDCTNAAAPVSHSTTNLLTQASLPLGTASLVVGISLVVGGVDKYHKRGGRRSVP